MERFLKYQGNEVTKEELDKIVSAPVTLLPTINWDIDNTTVSTLKINDNTISWVSQEPPAPKRLKCLYCDCINNKDYGTCDYCGAPLKDEEEEYSVKIKPLKPITRYRHY